jgi:hypothetical protein
LISLPIALLARRVSQARRQRLAVAQVRSCGGHVYFDWQKWAAPEVMGEPPALENPKPPGLAWVRRLVGDDYFQTVAAVTIDGLEVAGTGCSANEIALLVRRSFPQVKYLSLNCFEPCESTLEMIGELRDLRYLEVHGDGITAPGIARLRQLTNLRYVVISGATLTEESVKHLSALPRLEVLNIQCSGLSDQSLGHLPSFPSLEHLFLYAYSNGITDAGLIHFQRMRRLKYLDLRLDGMGITEHGLRHLESVKSLSYFAIKGGAVSEEELARLREKNPNVVTNLIVRSNEF